MNKKNTVYILLCLILIIAYIYFEPHLFRLIRKPQLGSINNIEPVRQGDRILILAPHPDDEAIGCAGIIQQAVRVGADIHILYFTNGDTNQLAFMVYEKRITFRKGEFIHMGRVRRAEAIKAMKLLGIDEDKLIFLGYPDFGTFTIFRDFWQGNKSYKSIATRVSSVPYKENFSFGKPYIGGSILEDIKNILKEYQPNKIFVSHPTDWNNDHKALYLFLQIALADLKQELPPPKIYPYLVHWKGWPLPRHYHPGLPLSPPEEFRGSTLYWSKYELTPQELEIKHKAILCYKSQTESSAFYLLSFARKNELLADFPEIYLDSPTQEKQISLKGQILPFFALSKKTSDSDALLKGGGCASYTLGDNSLLIHINKEKDSRRIFKTVIYLFGYNHKTPFAQMPKILIITRYNKFKVRDGKKVINPQGTVIELEPEELILKIPLSVLGNPDFILASVRTNMSSFCVDSRGFRKINLRR